MCNVDCKERIKQQFLDYLVIECHVQKNTVETYIAEIERFLTFCKKKILSLQIAQYIKYNNIFYFETVIMK